MATPAPPVLSRGLNVVHLFCHPEGTVDAGAVRKVAESHVSVTEVSEYAAGTPEKILQDWLFPVLLPEGMKAFCFYPMSKRRGQEHNWYSLSYDERLGLIRRHGSSGRELKNRVLQVVTGSTGLDDWERGVTLFGVHIDDLKDYMYTMRFDEASTLYGEFGAFYTGIVGNVGEVLGAALA